MSLKIAMHKLNKAKQKITNARELIISREIKRFDYFKQVVPYLLIGQNCHDVIMENKFENYN